MTGKIEFFKRFPFVLFQKNGKITSANKSEISLILENNNCGFDRLGYVDLLNEKWNIKTSYSCRKIGFIRYKIVPLKISNNIFHISDFFQSHKQFLVIYDSL